jgi:hypothetical protein
MSPTLLISPLFFDRTWIVSIYIIDAFHLNFPGPGSYHHIPYPIYVDVHHVLHNLVINMAIDSFDIVALYMHPPPCMVPFFGVYQISSMRWRERPLRD